MNVWSGTTVNGNTLDLICLLMKDWQIPVPASGLLRSLCLFLSRSRDPPLAPGWRKERENKEV